MAKNKYPWLDKAHPDLRQLVLYAEKRRAVVSYDAEKDTVRFDYKGTGALDGSVEVYNASSGELVMKAMS
jgi:hypothetical protein